MKFSTLLIGFTGLLASTVQAGIFTDQPFEKVTWNSGSKYDVIWNDDGKSPSIKTLNNLKIELMAGTEDTQFPVDVIATGVKGTAQKVSYTVKKNIGPSGNFYFIKYTSGSYTAYSGTFTIAGTTGNIPNFDPNNPGVPLTATKSGASTSTSDASSPSSTSSASAAGQTSSSSSASPSTSAVPKSSGSSTIYPSSNMAGLSLAIVLLAVSYLY
ncbi:1362_t:CDS:2 [Acaulospora morrowiae]|uniref:1362_t:CDS:1 n=1 Tax=Acaulospora morrowiae TaxID=94023 RepID=A0A9N8WDG5_9GLOM|nr:1362_t:CDS:2 [Acaulospora morrowiae]